MNFLKKVLTIFVAVLLVLFALSVVVKHNPSDSGKESERYSESKTAGSETGSEKESESVSTPSESGTKPTKKVGRIVLNKTEIIF